MWIIPKTLSAFVPDMAGSNLDFDELASILERSAMWRSKPSLKRTWLQKIEQGKMDSAPIWSDLKTFPARQFSGKVHGIIAGYPCQPFSHAGKREGADDPRHLWPYIEQHVRTIKPLWCFFENVSGHLSLGFDEVAQSLRDMGYKVEAGLFTAAEVGAPHKRERLFILGYTGSCGLHRNNGWRPGEVVADRHSELAHPQSQRCGEAGPDSGRSEERPGGAVAVADTDSPRTSPGGENRGMGRKPQPAPQWPACPGQEQYNWEEPRTVEPGMGRTANGHPCRVDSLRLDGNGVVPQQAALAFRKLLTLKKE